jgi:hypothetical protein
MAGGAAAMVADHLEAPFLREPRHLVRATTQLLLAPYLGPEGAERVAAESS